jgi:hypothetical protein
MGGMVTLVTGCLLSRSLSRKKVERDRDIVTTPSLFLLKIKNPYFSSTIEVGGWTL